MIEDDGHGVATGTREGQDGLMNLDSRMREVGGQFECQSKAGRGTTISLTVPVRGQGGTIVEKR